jgi:Polyketide cyclase / dehydrase and lipid transport
MRVEHTSVLPVSVEEGYAYITSVRNWPEYWPGLIEVRDETSWSKPGDRAVVVMRLIGRRVDLVMTLGELRPNELVVYRTDARGPLPSARHERRFRERDGRLEYALAVEYEPRRGARGLVDRLLVRRAAERAFARTTANLEEIFSSRSRAAPS